MAAWSYASSRSTSSVCWPSSGGGNRTDAKDLADIFELQKDKLRNQYETVQRGQQQNRQPETTHQAS